MKHVAGGWEEEKEREGGWIDVRLRGHFSEDEAGKDVDEVADVWGECGVLDGSDWVGGECEGSFCRGEVGVGDGNEGGEHALVDSAKEFVEDVDWGVLGVWLV